MRLDKKEGQRRKEQGIQQVLDNAGEEWRAAALNKVREWAAGPGRRCVEGVFAFEEVRAWALENGLPAPHSHNAWGGVAQYACRLGIIKFTGQYGPASSPRTHGHAVRLYTVGGAT